MDTRKHVRKIAAADRLQAHQATRRHHTLVVRGIARLTDLADQPPLIGLALTTIAVGAATHNGRVARTGTRMLAAHVAATAAKTLLKSVVDRTRPSRAIRKGHRLAVGNGTSDTSMNSFPSGHTAGAVAIAEAIATESAKVGTPARLAAIVVGVLQPARGKHYLSDVLAGAILGWAAARVTGPVVKASWREAARWRTDLLPNSSAQGCPVPPAAP